MTKVVKAKYKVSRKLGTSIWGDAKDPYHTKNYKPGQHGSSTISRSSDYGMHLKAKQRLKSHYGRITEKQFRKIFEKARIQKGNTSENFIKLLESRLDSVTYRMNFANSIFGARQLVSHKHILVNQKPVNIPSYIVKEGDIVSIKDKSKEIISVTESLNSSERKVPDYVESNPEKLTGTFLRKPSVSDVPYPFEPEMHLIVEFYSR